MKCRKTPPLCTMARALTRRGCVFFVVAVPQVYDPATGTYTAAPAAATPTPQSSSFSGQSQYSQQR